MFLPSDISIAGEDKIGEVKDGVRAPEALEQFVAARECKNYASAIAGGPNTCLPRLMEL